MTGTAFFVSTLAVSVLSPLGLFLISVVLVQTVPLSWLKKRRVCLTVLLTLLFAFACTDFCGKTMLSALEHLADKQPPLRGEHPVVFVVLGGGAVAEGDMYQPSVSSQRRLRHAQRMMSKRSDSRLLLSGIESPVMARWLGNVPFIMEPHSLNTRANIAKSAQLLRHLYPDPQKRPAVCIVTDRFHAPRAMRCAWAEMNDFEVCAAPAPSLVRRAPWRLFHFIPTSVGLNVTSMAWRETLALLRDWVFYRTKVFSQAVKSGKH